MDREQAQSFLRAAARKRKIEEEKFPHVEPEDDLEISDYSTSDISDVSDNTALNLITPLKRNHEKRKLKNNRKRRPSNGSSTEDLTTDSDST